MKSKILVALLLLAVGLSTATGFKVGDRDFQAAGTIFNTKDLAEYGVTIVNPADPAYDAMVAGLSENKPNVMVEALRPFSVFIKNTSGRTVVAFALKWELMQPDGKIRIDESDNTALWSLTGGEVSNMSEGVIRPGAAWFSTPFHPEAPHVPPTRGGSDAARSEPEATEELNRLREELAQYTNITVSLDGAFFDDGTFVGPDSTEFFAKVEAMRNARYDLLDSVKKNLTQGSPPDEVFGNLKEIENGPAPQLSSSSSPADYYSAFRKATAAELLRVRETYGDAQPVERVMQKLRKPWPVLRKVR
ncbi:MAG: hypothetical protein M3416_08730 [Acidobacteriota bacterium]|nr:hypothetical protein [Acidobacteriota bacterium]